MVAFQEIKIQTNRIISFISLADRCVFTQTVKTKNFFEQE